MTATENLPLWSVTDVHESLTSRSFVDSLERVKSDVGRLEALYDELGIREPYLHRLWARVGTRPL